MYIGKDVFNVFENETVALEPISAKSWKKAQTIREYISEMERKVKNEDLMLEEESKEYIAWAKQKANGLDPLHGFEDPILGKVK